MAEKGLLEMSYSGGLLPGWCELMRSDGIPLYGGQSPVGKYRYRLKFRPHARSEGVVHRAQFGEETLWWRGDYALFDTRADAAAAAYAGKYDWLTDPDKRIGKLTSGDIDRELERAWETQPAPEYNLSAVECECLDDHGTYWSRGQEYCMGCGLR